MIEKQFGTAYGPALQRGEKTACIIGLQAEVDRSAQATSTWSLAALIRSGGWLFAFRLLFPLVASQRDTR